MIFGVRFPAVEAVALTLTAGDVFGYNHRAQLEHSTSRGAKMKKSVFLVLLALALAAGGATTAKESICCGGPEPICNPDDPNCKPPATSFMVGSGSIVLPPLPASAK
jgi:hypothetical protein